MSKKKPTIEFTRFHMILKSQHFDVSQIINSLKFLLKSNIEFQKKEVSVQFMNVAFKEFQ